MGLGSCSKGFLNTRIDVKPTPGSVDQIYSTLIGYANAPYTVLQNYNGFTVLDSNLFAPVSDEAVQTSSVGKVYAFNNGTWSQFNNPNDYYNFYYGGIYAANYFFEYLQQMGGNYRLILAMNRDTVTTNNNTQYHLDVTQMGWSIAEAHIVRAYCYFELAKRYGGVPVVTQTYQVSQNAKLPASSYDSIVHFIVSEIDTYKDSLQANWKTTAQFATEDGKFSLGSALALKARTLLYAASPLHNASGDVTKWQAAAAAANDAVVFAQNPAGGQNSLDGNYQNYFLATNMLSSPETILAVRFGADNYLEKQNYPVGTLDGHSGVTPTDDLVSAYEYTGTPDPNNPYNNRDPRLGYTIVTNGSTWNSRTINEAPGGSDDMTVTNASKTGYYLKKFLNDNVDLQNGATHTRNWPIYRYGELLLEYAEAMNEAYGPDNANGYGLTARQALNMVRGRPGVGMPPVTVADQAGFRSAVKHERRIELAFEDHRYWDLLRWMDAAAVQSQPLHGVVIAQNGGQFVYTQRVVQNRAFVAPKMYLFPFSQAEITISNGSITQNPGW
jgi:hypothetical protein